MKRAKNRKTNIYHYDVNDVVPETVIKGIGNLTIKHLLLSCFYCHFEKPVFRFLPFSEFKKKEKKKKRKRKVKKSTAFLINIKVPTGLQMSVSIILICLWLIQNTTRKNGMMVYIKIIYI